MISFFGLNSSHAILTKALPNEPVPPVIRMVVPFRSARGLLKSRMPKAARSSSFREVCITGSRIRTYGVQPDAPVIVVNPASTNGGQGPDNTLGVIFVHCREQGQRQDPGVEGLGAGQPHWAVARLEIGLSVEGDVVDLGPDLV